MKIDVIPNQFKFKFRILRDQDQRSLISFKEEIHLTQKTLLGLRGNNLSLGIRITIT